MKKERIAEKKRSRNQKIEWLKNKLRRKREINEEEKRNK